MEEKNVTPIRALSNNLTARSFLALCIVVAGITTGMKGVVIGVALTAMLLCGSLVLSILQKLLNENGKIAATILIYCALAGVAKLLADRCFASLMSENNLLIPLLAAACIVSGVGDVTSCEHCVPAAVGTAFLRGVEFTVVLVIVGVIREFLSAGSVFGARLLTGGPVLFAQYPASGFVLLGVICGIVALCKHGKGAAK